MIKNFFRSIAINALGLFICTRISSGLISFTGDTKAFLSAGLAIVIINILVRPLVNLLLLPLHILTLGTFRWITNLIMLYLFTKFIPSFSIGSFITSKIDLGFIILPPVYFSALGSFILASLIFSLVFQLLYWLFEV